MESIVFKCKAKDLQKNILIHNLVELLNKNAQLFYEKKNVKFFDFDFIDRCYYQDAKELYKVIILFKRSLLFNDFGKVRNDLFKKIIHNFELLLDLSVKENNKKELKKILTLCTSTSII